MNAIKKILKKRDILPQMCKVVSSQDPESKPIDLNVDLEALSNVRYFSKHFINGYIRIFYF